MNVEITNYVVNHDVGCCVCQRSDVSSAQNTSLLPWSQSPQANPSTVWFLVRYQNLCVDFNLIWIPVICISKNFHV